MASSVNPDYNTEQSGLPCCSEPACVHCNRTRELLEAIRLHRIVPCKNVIAECRAGAVAMFARAEDMRETASIMRQSLADHKKARDSAKRKGLRNQQQFKMLVVVPQIA